MAWRRPGDKPLSEPMMVRLLAHVCVTRPQWVKRAGRWLVKCLPTRGHICASHYHWILTLKCFSCRPMRMHWQCWSQFWANYMYRSADATSNWVCIMRNGGSMVELWNGTTAGTNCVVNSMEQTMSSAELSSPSCGNPSINRLHGRKAWESINVDKIMHRGSLLLWAQPMRDDVTL